MFMGKIAAQLSYVYSFTLIYPRLLYPHCDKSKSTVKENVSFLFVLIEILTLAICTHQFSSIWGPMAPVSLFCLTYCSSEPIGKSCVTSWSCVPGQIPSNRTTHAWSRLPIASICCGVKMLLLVDILASQLSANRHTCSVTLPTARVIPCSLHRSQ